jgi:hypothetical protein
MATTRVLTHRGAHQWYQLAPSAASEVPQILMAVALWIVLLVAMVLFVAAGVTWVFTTFSNAGGVLSHGTWDITWGL